MSRSPTLAEVVREALEARLADVHVCLPGRVTAVDNNAQTVDVKPAIKSRARAGDNVVVDDLPVIPSVPYAIPRVGSWLVHLPVAVGDYVLLVFSERSMDIWRSVGGSAVDPNDIRMHSIADAIAMPCNVSPDAALLPPQAWANLVIGRAGGSTVQIKSDIAGTIALGSENPTDSVATANKTIAELNAVVFAFYSFAVALNSTLAGPFPPVATAFTALIASLTTAGYLTPVPVPGTPSPKAPSTVASAKVKIDP